MHVKLENMQTQEAGEPLLETGMEKRAEKDSVV